MSEAIGTAELAENIGYRKQCQIGCREGKIPDCNQDKKFTVADFQRCCFAGLQFIDQNPQLQFQLGCVHILLSFHR